MTRAHTHVRAAVVVARDRHLMLVLLRNHEHVQRQREGVSRGPLFAPYIDVNRRLAPRGVLRAAAVVVGGGYVQLVEAAA